MADRTFGLRIEVTADGLAVFDQTGKKVEELKQEFARSSVVMSTNREKFEALAATLGTTRERLEAQGLTWGKLNVLAKENPGGAIAKGLGQVEVASRGAAEAGSGVGPIIKRSADVAKDGILSLIPPTEKATGAMGALTSVVGGIGSKALEEGLETAIEKTTAMGGAAEGAGGKLTALTGSLSNMAKSPIVAAAALGVLAKQLYDLQSAYIELKNTETDADAAAAQAASTHGKETEQYTRLAAILGTTTGALQAQNISYGDLLSIARADPHGKIAKGVAELQRESLKAKGTLDDFVAAKHFSALSADAQKLVKAYQDHDAVSKQMDSDISHTIAIVGTAAKAYEVWADEIVKVGNADIMAGRQMSASNAERLKGAREVTAQHQAVGKAILDVDNAAANATALPRAYEELKVKLGSTKKASIELKDEVQAAIERYAKFGETAPEALRKTWEEIQRYTRVLADAAAREKEFIADRDAGIARNLAGIKAVTGAFENQFDALKALEAQGKAVVNQYNGIKASQSLTGEDDKVVTLGSDKQAQIVDDLKRALKDPKNANLDAAIKEAIAQVKAGNLSAVAKLTESIQGRAESDRLAVRSSGGAAARELEADAVAAMRLADTLRTVQRDMLLAGEASEKAAKRIGDGLERADARAEKSLGGMRAAAAGTLATFLDLQAAMQSTGYGGSAEGYGGSNAAVFGGNLPPAGVIPQLATGGTVERTGVAVIHRGETVTPAGGGSSNAEMVALLRELVRHARDGKTISVDGAVLASIGNRRNAANEGNLPGRRAR